MDRNALTTRAVVAELDALTAEHNAIQVRLLRSIVECDLRRVYRADDCDSMERWLSLRLGISRWKAQRMITTAYAVDELPKTTAAFERGEISLDKLFELARFATRATEGKLVTWAKNVTPRTIRDRADVVRRADDEEVKAGDRARSLEWWWQDDSTLSFWGNLPADQGHGFIAAVDRLADKLGAPDNDDNVDARRADALVMMASATISNDQCSDRATVVVHATVEGLRRGDRNAVVSGGRALHPALAQLLTCDARVQTVLHDERGKVVDIASTARLVPSWLRRQVEHRDDYSCTFPNCGTRRFTQAHHIVPWPGGPTALDNLTLLCPFHHRLVHVHGWHVSLTEDGTTRWARPDWTPYEPRPAPLVMARR